VVYNPGKHYRRSIRLKGYNYAQAGAYFVTICTQGKTCLFGEVIDREVRYNDAGRMVANEWEKIPERFPNVILDTFIVMPNHIHGIIIITDPAVGAGLVPAQNMTIQQNNTSTVGAGLVPAPNRATTRVAPTIGEIVGAFKSITTVCYTQSVHQCGWQTFPSRLWQRNYYEHIIRNEISLNRIREYINTNPIRWHLDKENPHRIGEDDLWNAIVTKDLGVTFRTPSKQSSPGGT